MVVVFDVNALIPLILPASRSTQLFLRLTKAKHAVAFSVPMLADVQEKLRTDRPLRDWLKLSDEDIETFLDGLPKICMMTPGNVTVAGVVKADPDDDVVLAAAVEGGASYIVSEDRHLRKLGRWYGIEIMSRGEFSRELERLGL